MLCTAAVGFVFVASLTRVFLLQSVSVRFCLRLLFLSAPGIQWTAKCKKINDIA
jgi:hypothetical protein